MLYTMKEFTRQVAARIRAELAIKRLTASEMSTATGVSYKTLNRRLGGNSAWTSDEIVVIADYLAVPIRHLLEVPSIDVDPATAAEGATR